MQISNITEKEKESLIFDKVSTFKNYYPLNNLKEIIQQNIELRKTLIQEKSFKRSPAQIPKTMISSLKMKEFQFRKSMTNKISPISVIPEVASSKFVTPSMKTNEYRRTSNIFVERIDTKNFFQRPKERMTFYDIVNEVLHNKLLRKNLNVIRSRSLHKHATLYNIQNE